MTRYDSAHDPPALILDVEILHPVDQTKEQLKGKIDTGASMTVIPASVRQKLKLEPAGEVDLTDYKGVHQTSPTYFVRIKINEVTEDLEVTSVERKDVLIGRDALSAWKITADGKNQDFTMEDP